MVKSLANVTSGIELAELVLSIDKYESTQSDNYAEMYKTLIASEDEVQAVRAMIDLKRFQGVKTT